jgi:hypothetical protein
MRYILGILAVIIVIIVASMLIFGGRGRDDVDREPLMVEYSQRPAEVVYTARGRIVGDEDFRTVRITVNRTERIMEVLYGYEEEAEVYQTYPNNSEAYTTFMLALDQAGFARERDTNTEDERGVCPLGRRYVYELIEGPNEILRNWSASCSRRLGSFAGDSAQVRRLFEGQIPDYRDATRGVRL